MRTLKRLSAAFGAAALLLAAGSAWAAKPSIAGATVSLTSLAGGFAASAVTSEHGANIDNAVPPGTYRVTVVLDASDPKVRAVAGDVYVEVEVGGRQVSCTRADLRSGKPYSAALLIEAADAQPVVVHLVPVAPKTATALIPERRGVND